MFRIWTDMALLTAESQEVVGLRMMKLAAGGMPAIDEANRMIVEKVLEAQKSAISLLTGASPDSVVRAYRGKVRANARRLSKQALDIDRK